VGFAIGYVAMLRSELLIEPRTYIGHFIALLRLFVG